ncbi:MAG: DNA-binding protein [Azoarcus sp.]
MTATARITRETVADTAAEIESRGDTPSVRKVLAVLGGSPNTIAPLLKEWRVSRPAGRAAQIAIDPRIARLIAEQIQAAEMEAARAAQARLAEVLDDADVVAEAGRAAEKHAAELAIELEAVRAKVQQQAGQIAQMKEDASQVKADAADRVRAAEDRAAVEATKAEAAQKALARAELKLESLPKLEADLETVRDEARQARDQANSVEHELVGVRVEVKALQAAFERQGMELAEAKAVAREERKRADAAEREYGKASAQVQSQQVALDAASQRVRDLEVWLKGKGG